MARGGSGCRSESFRCPVVPVSVAFFDDVEELADGLQPTKEIVGDAHPQTLFEGFDDLEALDRVEADLGNLIPFVHVRTFLPEELSAVFLEKLQHFRSCHVASVGLV